MLIGGSVFEAHRILALSILVECGLRLLEKGNAGLGRGKHIRTSCAASVSRLENDCSSVLSTSPQLCQ